MPVTAASLAQIPYQVKGIQVPEPVAAPPPQGYTGPVKYRGVHTIYPTLSGRINYTLTAPAPGGALWTIRGNQHNQGNAIFLKFFADEITSIRLPCPAPAGVDLFVTDNMTACKFYVDTIQGSNDLIVSHANTHQFPPGRAADADYQNPQADAILDGMHQAAQGDYAAAGLTLTNVAACAKPTYFQNAGHAERRKKAQGRRTTENEPLPGEGPHFVGACTIVGFPHAGTWQFWYQTWGDVSYRRPSGVAAVAKSVVTFHWHHLHKLRVEGKDHVVSDGSMKVIDCRRIY